MSAPKIEIGYRALGSTGKWFGVSPRVESIHTEQVYVIRAVPGEPALGETWMNRWSRERVEIIGVPMGEGATRRVLVRYPDGSESHIQLSDLTPAPTESYRLDLTVLGFEQGEEVEIEGSHDDVMARIADALSKVER